MKMNKTYLSDYTEINEKAEKQLKNLLELAAKGELSYMIVEIVDIIKPIYNFKAHN